MFEIGRFAPLLLWKPCIEYDFGQERFLIDDPTKLFSRGEFAQVSVMVGITEMEIIKPAIGKWYSFIDLLVCTILYQFHVTNVFSYSSK